MREQMIRTGWGEVRLRAKYAGAATAFFSLAYGATNHLPMSPPQRLPWLPFETLIPVVPETFWIYMSAVPMLFVYFFYEEDRLRALRYLVSYLSLVLFCAIVFAFFPTVYPREYYPIQGHVDPVLQLGFNILRFVDAPSNCFPSLHVAGAVLAALVSQERRERVSRWFPLRFSHVMTVWAVAISLSTLTTKQHYLLDVISGALSGYLAYQVFFLNMPDLVVQRLVLTQRAQNDLRE